MTADAIVKTPAFIRRVLPLAGTAPLFHRFVEWKDARMAPIDYEAEYNNRARVPEHPQIFSRWTHDAQAYRAQAHGRAELGLAYGPSARQTIDLFFSERGGDAPLTLFVHGGYWRSLEPATFSHMAAGLNERGITVGVVGYDLCPQVTIGSIIEQMRQACLFTWRRFGRRMVVFGHSAGGHLAAAMLATDWRTLDAPADLVPSSYAISGVFDLTPLVGISMNADLKLDAAEARRVSPAFWSPPQGCSLDAVVGALESSEFLRQSQLIVQHWGKAGVKTRYREVDGANHFTAIDPLTDPQSAMVERLAALAAPR